MILELEYIYRIFSSDLFLITQFYCLINLCYQGSLHTHTTKKGLLLSVMCRNVVFLYFKKLIEKV